MSDPFAPFERKLRAAGSPPAAIESFRHYYAELRAGRSGLLSRREIGPVIQHEQCSEPRAHFGNAIRRSGHIAREGALVPDLEHARAALQNRLGAFSDIKAAAGGGISVEDGIKARETHRNNLL